jgi:hypothetical protein
MSLSPKEDLLLLKLLEADVQSVCPFADASDFLRRGCYTKDEARQQVRQFPVGGRFEYLYRLTEIRGNHPILAVEKSRRMMATWWALAVLLYELLTVPNLAIAVVSKKATDSAYLCGADRLQFMYEHIPDDLWPNKPTLSFTGKIGNGYTFVENASIGSSIRAIASGPDQLRSYTFSRIFLDEFAFHENAEAEWTACKPCIEGGGHIDMVSTPELGAYMYDLIYDVER